MHTHSQFPMSRKIIAAPKMHNKLNIDIYIENKLTPNF